MADMLNVAQQTISDRLKAMGKIQKCEKWVPHELNERQMENRKTLVKFCFKDERKSVLHQLSLAMKNGFILRILNGKSWVNPGQPSASTAKPDRFGKKAMLCVWWDQKGVVYYELLKPGETVNTSRYKQQMIDLNALIENDQEQTRQSNFVTRQCACTQSKIGSGYNQSKLGVATPPAVFTGLGSFRLPFIFIDGTRIG
ncbi:Mariner Mos1 transposase [Eumeta japonica]|uniref:Mariner Mos1 transposase n=1 Tax=Eumeta variegata TaxID=151549 RepID=A0A4C1ZQP1_EUMVA|nr:Mariner Mos1 transposase [Eumeta japonica]